MNKICIMAKKVNKYLSEKALKHAKGVRLEVKDEHIKYSKQQYTEIYKGYDMLENLFTVRIYIQKYYDISFNLLELILKLMAMRVFSREQFGEIPKNFTYTRFNKCLEDGIIVVLSNHLDVEQRLFTLSTKYRNIVINFYAYLSGEKEIPADSRYNPMNNSVKAVSYDKKKMDVIRKLNQQPVPEHFKVLFKQRK